VLDPLVQNGINVRHIENRPGTKAVGGHVSFILEVAGHSTDAPLQAALERLLESGVSAKVLGSHPANAWVDGLG
jgi:chorismate mutase/prephenate dehydratase